VAGVQCKTENNPCQLIEYQSLDSSGTEGGHGLTGLTHAQKDANDHDADGLDNDQHAYPNAYTTYNGTILPNPPAFHQYDYGERLKWATSVKYTCCKSDLNDYDTNGPLHDPSVDGAGVANGPASDENIAAQRMCPPPDGGTLGNLRYGDTNLYITKQNGDYGYDTDVVTDAGGNTYTQNCFGNRTLQSPVHLASITDYYVRNEAVYNQNMTDTGIPYLEDPADAWLQEKHPESFYQLCVAERQKKVLCCDGTSVAPCQRLGTGAAVDGNCKYPGAHVLWTGPASEATKCSVLPLDVCEQDTVPIRPMPSAPPPPGRDATALNA